MFVENFTKREIDLARIKNISEFGVKLEESKILFSKDNRYAVISTEATILILDMNKRILVSKFSNERHSRITKLKITPRNEITYLNIGDDVKFVVSSIHFFGHSLEITVPSDTRDYVYVCGAGRETKEDFLIALSSKGDLDFLMLGESIRRVRRNILVDSGKKINSGFEVNYMDYIEETKNLIIILANGFVLNYSVYINPEVKDEIQFTIAQEQMFSLDGDEASNRNIHDVTIFKVVKYLVIHDTNFGQENFLNLTYKSCDSSENVCLIIGSSVNKSNSVVNFYQLDDSRITFLNKIQIEKRIILDSFIFQPCNFYQSEIVSNYFLICTKAISTDNIEVFSSDFIQCLNKEFSHTQENMTRVSEFMDKIHRVGILGVRVVNNQDLLVRNLNKTLPNPEEDMCNNSVASKSNIDDYKNLDLSLSVTLRKMKNMKTAEVYVEDESLGQMSFHPKKRFLRTNIDTFDDEEIKGLITSDVNKHLILWDELVRKGSSADKILKFKIRVLKMLSEDSLFSSFTSILKFFPTLAHSDKFDFYLVCLLLNNESLSIKTYLSLRDNSTSKEFLVPNQNLFFTVFEILFTYLRDMILQHLKDKKLTNLVDERLILLIENIQTLMKTSLHRISHPYSRPFNLENDIQADQIRRIETIIYSLSMLILVVKVIRSYFNKFGQSDYVYATREKMKDKMRKKKQRRSQNITNDKAKLTYLELVLMTDCDNVYPNLEFFLYNALIDTLECFFREGVEVNPNAAVDNSENFLFFLKFRVFFFYLYYILESDEVGSNSISTKQSKLLDKSEEENLKLNYFFEMEEEFATYFPTAKNLFSLDSNIVNKREGQVVNVTQICDFLFRFNQSKITRSNYFKVNINVNKLNFNSVLITLLYLDDFKVEALAISKSIVNMLSDYEDLMTQLSLLQDMGLINLAFQFVNNCFAHLVCYSEELAADESFEQNRNFLKNLVKSSEFKTVKTLYFHFFDFLITNSHISLLFTLPFNFVERSLLKDFLVSRKEYEEVLLTYLIRLKKGKAASEVFSNLVKSGSLTHKSVVLYDNLLKTVKFLFDDRQESQIIKSKVESDLTCEVNISEEKKLVNELRDNLMNVDSCIQDLADKILIDSLMDIENEIFKPDSASLNDTLKTLISKKHESSRKNFGLFTDIKPMKRMQFDFASERYDCNFIDNSKFKSDFKDQIDQSGYTPKETNVRLDFKSDFKMTTSNFNRSKLNIDLTK